MAEVRHSYYTPLFMSRHCLVARRRAYLRINVSNVVYEEVCPNNFAFRYAFVSSRWLIKRHIIVFSMILQPKDVEALLLVLFSGVTCRLQNPTFELINLQV